MREKGLLFDIMLQMTNKSQQREKKSPDLVIVLDDYYNASLSCEVLKNTQYVSCPTKEQGGPLLHN